MPQRAMPRVGAAVTIRYLDSRVAGTVAAIEESGRRLCITTEEGETLIFELNAATATFTAGGALTGARLSFEHGDDAWVA